jgi:hypothetical protein
VVLPQWDNRLPHDRLDQAGEVDELRHVETVKVAETGLVRHLPGGCDGFRRLGRSTID